MLAIEESLGWPAAAVLLLPVRPREVRVLDTLKSHLEHADPDAEEPEWRREDSKIVIWIYNIILDSFVHIMMTTNDTAMTAWMRLHHYFLENKGCSGYAE
jgi:hypothetical protein